MLTVSLDMERKLKRKLETDARLNTFHAAREPGRAYSLSEIAAGCGCSMQNIHTIQQRALRRALKHFSVYDR
jgi:hypothetical protein